MKRHSAVIAFVFGWLFVLSTPICFAQETFRVRNSSPAYDLDVTINKCDEEQKRLSPTTCSGPGKIRIYRKGTASPFQILALKNIEISTDQTAYNARVDKNERKLYDDEYSLIFDDFNFDGNEDLAVCTGREGGYGGPSYKVYLYDVTLKKFTENVRLSMLTEGGYLGLFFVDSKKKHLTAYSKSGCCYHETDTYKVINNKPVLVEKIIEEATRTDETSYDLVITTKRLVNGKWIKRVRKKRVKEDSP